MKCEIRYYTVSGNTKKQAEKVAEICGIQAKTVSEDLDEPVDMLFLGGAIYAGGIDREIVKFLKRNKDKIKNVAFFCSYCAISPENQMKKILKKMGINCKSTFGCYGKFLMKHKDHPNEYDMNQLAMWTEIIIEKQV